MGGANGPIRGTPPSSGFSPPPPTPAKSPTRAPRIGGGWGASPSQGGRSPRGGGRGPGGARTKARRPVSHAVSGRGGGRQLTPASSDNGGRARREEGPRPLLSPADPLPRPLQGPGPAQAAAAGAASPEPPVPPSLRERLRPASDTKQRPSDPGPSRTPTPLLSAGMPSSSALATAGLQPTPPPPPSNASAAAAAAAATTPGPRTHLLGPSRPATLRAPTDRGAHKSAKQRHVTAPRGSALAELGGTSLPSVTTSSIPPHKPVTTATADRPDNSPSKPGSLGLSLQNSDSPGPRTGQPSSSSAVC
ncbi:arf-GAP with GTPase, ANK repeat and PH domain-containing protein 2-like [Dromiciops gliroides]|uniref:arf-GAP with GTPase, ANK repeat and PH domain-containing protein 2-like n=1 Tax=Dromiciops gliroides TaxID=33562 RepID=UPI001CC39425|nr:arf-GAP with GTPase, ANK repeat and PH domain-containing protein 2-like [Dromiciops gliroides]